MVQRTTETTPGVRDRRVILSILWIFLLFNYVYADILILLFGSALRPNAWQQLLSGQVGALQITQVMALLGSIAMETSIAMVLLSWVLPYRVNRWATIIVAVIQAVQVVGTLPGSLYSNLFNYFFSAIEIACLAFIVWYAWTWRRSQAQLAGDVESEPINSVQRGKHEAA
jgi:MFS family permease